MILFVDDRLAVIARERPGVGRYLVLPGGGVEPGETPAQAAVREAYEETGLRVEVPDVAYLRVTRIGASDWLFRATAVGGTFGTGTGIEVTGGRPGRGTYRPLLVTREQAAGENLLPLPVGEHVLQAWSTGRWSSSPAALDDPDGLVPGRVRAGNVVIRDGAILLIERNRGGRRWYEIPGGGVEAGERPDAAAIRELREETGLTGQVGREVAVVFKDQTRQHYFVVAAAGELGERAGLDLEPDARPVWIGLADLPTTAVWPKRLAWRIPAWYAHGWPTTPLRLHDSVVDLAAPCDW